jgi:hypothetical protein
MSMNAKAGRMCVEVLFGTLCLPWLASEQRACWIAWPRARPHERRPRGKSGEGKPVAVPSLRKRRRKRREWDEPLHEKKMLKLYNNRHHVCGMPEY